MNGTAGTIKEVISGGCRESDGMDGFAYADGFIRSPVDFCGRRKQISHHIFHGEDFQVPDDCHKWSTLFHRTPEKVDRLIPNENIKHFWNCTIRERLLNWTFFHCLTGFYFHKYKIGCFYSKVTWVHCQGILQRKHTLPFIQVSSRLCTHVDFDLLTTFDGCVQFLTGQYILGFFKFLA